MKYVILSPVYKSILKVFSFENIDLYYFFLFSTTLNLKLEGSRKVSIKNR